jgi:hypothetical protein
MEGRGIIGYTKWIHLSEEDEKEAVNGVRGGECTVASLADGMWEASSGAAGKTSESSIPWDTSQFTALCVKGTVAECKNAEKACHSAR